MVGSHALVPALVAGLFALLTTTPALAASVVYRVDLVITADELGFFGIGTSQSVYLDLESTTVDTDPAANTFAGANAGVFDPNFSLAGTSSIATVDAFVDPPLGSWTATGTLVPPLVGDVDWILELVGEGLTPDQVLPDFDTLSWGTFAANETFVAGDVVALVLVPEPSTALLVGAGLVAVARRRGRRAR